MASRLTKSTNFAMQSIADSWRGVKSDSWAATTIPVDPSTTDFDGVSSRILLVVTLAKREAQLRHSDSTHQR